MTEQLLENPNHRPVRDSLSVGEAATAHDSRVVERGKELVGEARLPDSRRAEEREKLAGAVSKRSGERIVQPFELSLSADHRGDRSTGYHGGIRQDSDEAEGCDRL
jgi:hypothetical protein